MSRLTGIYKIEDIKTGNIYIGSSKDIKKRWSYYLAKFRKGAHSYSGLQAAWNDNVNNIKWEILELCDVKDLQDREDYYIAYCGSVDGWTVINIRPKQTSRCLRDNIMINANQAGESNGHSRLTKSQVKEILFLSKYSNLIQQQIGDKYGVSGSHIANIVSGLKWPSVNGEMSQPSWYVG